MRKWIGVAATAGALVVIGALPAGAGKDGGAAPLHVHKVVVGPVPTGTQFVETVTCDKDMIFKGGNPAASSAQLLFDAQGNPVGTGDTLTFVDGGDCTVTETQNGGAASVIYECESTAPEPPVPAAAGGRFSPRIAGVTPFEFCHSTGPQSDPISFLVEVEDQDVTVTVTNTFVKPTPSEPAPTPSPAVAVVGAPLFTG